MFPDADILLWSWTALAAVWWLVAVGLVVRLGRPDTPSVAPDARRITVFKPLPRLGERDLDRLAPCLESFVAALDERSELIIGGHEADGPALAALLETLGRRYPAAAVELVLHRDPSHQSNPKVAWMEILASRATGELWLWSDADIQAPPHVLATLRRDIAVPGTGFVTSPYVVSGIDRPPETLDALFVNVEFFPGVLLLGRLDLIRFGFGSGMLFAATEFRRRVDWDRLGSCVAEDFVLGRALAPSRLGSTRLCTSPAAADWPGAILHYLRWQKTIRWCRPGSFAAQLTILPLLGWLAWLPWHLTSVSAWAGFGATLVMEALAALAICRALGCRLRPELCHALAVWSLVRGLAWAVCWLPWPITFGGKRWWSLYRETRRTEILEPGSQVGLD